MSEFKKSTFENGLKVITKSLPSTQAVTVLILVGAGSRYETKDINGISHFLEHMFFKGAKRYETTKAVAEAIDGVGGEFNAFTGKEYVGYYVKVAKKHIGVAMDVLSDMMLNSKFDQSEIDRERTVIMEEYNMYQDTPMQQIGWDFESLIYGDQPMGWDQVGTKENIMGFKRDQFVDYKDKLYSPDNTVISVAGDIDHDDVVVEVKRLFDFGNSVKAYLADPVLELKRDKFVHLRNKKTEQAHVMLGFPGYKEHHPDHYALKLLTIILGGSMSSRMFLSVRERQGLSYYISTSSDDYTDTGIVSTNSGVTVDRVDDAIKAILAEYKKMVDVPVLEAELVKSKEFLKGKMILKFEDSEEYAHLLAKFQVLYNEGRTLEDIFAEVDKVTIEDISRVARDLFKEDKLYLSVIGPYNDEEHFANLLKF